MQKIKSIGQSVQELSKYGYKKLRQFPPLKKKSHEHVSFQAQALLESGTIFFLLIATSKVLGVLEQGRIHGYPSRVRVGRGHN